jgi:hypothetical protein
MFIFENGRPDAAKLPHLDLYLGRLRSLTDDLDRLRSGHGPTADELAAAPLLDLWQPAAKADPCLVGASSGHPLLPGDGRLIHTSALWAFDREAGWARTLSRWYRLGTPLPRSLHQGGGA